MAPSTNGLPGGRVASQEVARGWRPVEVGSMYTMPQRLTVAGEATARSSTSNIMVMDSVSWMISPLTRHSFLLSSRTCAGGRGRGLVMKWSEGRSC